MRRIACLLVMTVILGAFAGPASARRLTVRTDPNDTLQPPDIRKVWTARNHRGVYVRVGAWDRLRRDDGFIVVLDTKGDSRDDRIIEFADGIVDCLVWTVDPTPPGLFGDLIGERRVTKPDRRSIACLAPNGWFDIRKTVRFYVKSGIGGYPHRDRAPDARHFLGL
jgi:hypothetical protein